jgi:hypothetical protein
MQIVSPEEYAEVKKADEKNSLLVSIINPRLTDYSNAKLLALLILIGSIGGFAGLFISSLKNCPVNSSMVEKIEYSIGSLPVQRTFVDSIWDPPDAKEKEDNGITREVELCIENGRSFAVSGTMVVDGMCRLPDDAGFKSSGWPITWCDGSEASENSLYKSQTVSLKCGFKEGETAEDGMSGTTVPFTARFKVKVTETQTVCPGFASALGSSLAYIGYLELVFTGLIGGLFILLGISKPLKNRATLAGLLKSGNSVQTSIDSAADELQAQIHEIQEKIGLKTGGKGKHGV